MTTKQGIIGSLGEKRLLLPDLVPSGTVTAIVRKAQGRTAVRRLPQRAWAVPLRTVRDS